MMKKLALMLVVSLLVSFGSAFAVPLYPGEGTNPGTLFEDDNLDYFADNDQDGLISSGDVLYSAVEFTKIIDLVGGAGEYNLDRDNDELVAWATIEVDSVAGPIWTYKQFGDIPMIQVYSGGDINLDWSVAGNDPTLAQAEAAIIDGFHLWDFSITDDPDTFWSFTPLNAAANDPSIVAGLLQSTKIGVANYQLNQVWGDDIFNFLLGDVVIDDGLVDLAGSGDILGGRGLVNGAFARSDIDAVVNPIPEPSTFLLLGAGLLGLVGIARKRSRN